MLKFYYKLLMLFSRETLTVLVSKPFFDRLPVSDELCRRTPISASILRLASVACPNSCTKVDLSVASNKLTIQDIPLIRIWPRTDWLYQPWACLPSPGLIAPKSNRGMWRVMISCLVVRGYDNVKHILYNIYKRVTHNSILRHHVINF